MMKRPLSPSDLPTTSLGPSPSRLSRLSSFKQQASRFHSRLSPPIARSARTVCLLLGALCLLFFLAEMSENSSIASTPTAATGAAAAGNAAAGAAATAEGGTGGPEEEGQDDTSQPLGGGLPGGLRRFGNFEEYVVSERESRKRACCSWESKKRGVLHAAVFVSSRMPLPTLALVCKLYIFFMPLAKRVCQGPVAPNWRQKNGFGLLWCFRLCHRSACPAVAVDRISVRIRTCLSRLEERERGRDTLK